MVHSIPKDEMRTQQGIGTQGRGESGHFKPRVKRLTLIASGRQLSCKWIEGQLNILKTKSRQVIMTARVWKE